MTPYPSAAPKIGLEAWLAHPVPLPQERLNNGQCLAFFIAGGGLLAHDACAEYRLRPFADQKRLANASAPTYFPYMGSRMSHALIDHINAAQDRLIASELGRNRRALGIARGNLRRWMARDGSKVRPAFREWDRILDRLTPAEIANFLRSDTPMARRLRQSSPFAGVLTGAERRTIRQKHEKAGA